MVINLKFTIHALPNTNKGGQLVVKFRFQGKLISYYLIVSIIRSMLAIVNMIVTVII